MGSKKYFLSLHFESVCQSGRYFVDSHCDRMCTSHSYSVKINSSRIHRHDPYNKQSFANRVFKLANVEEFFSICVLSKSTQYLWCQLPLVCLFGQCFHVPLKTLRLWHAIKKYNFQ